MAKSSYLRVSPTDIPEVVNGSTAETVGVPHTASPALIKAIIGKAQVDARSRKDKDLLADLSIAKAAIVQSTVGKGRESWIDTKSAKTAFFWGCEQAVEVNRKGAHILFD